MQYVNMQNVMDAINKFDAACACMNKVAYTPTAPPPPPMSADPSQGAPPPDGGAPMPPDQGGAPMPPQGGAPMPPDQGGAPMPPDQGGAPMPPDGGMPPGGQGGAIGPELEQMLAQFAEGVQGMGDQVSKQEQQLAQLTDRFLQLEQTVSSLKDGLKGPAGLEGQAPATGGKPVGM